MKLKLLILSVVMCGTAGCLLPMQQGTDKQENGYGILDRWGQRISVGLRLLGFGGNHFSNGTIDKAEGSFRLESSGDSQSEASLKCRIVKAYLEESKQRNVDTKTYVIKNGDIKLYKYNLYKYNESDELDEFNYKSDDEGV